MRIALATLNGKTVTGHFGRTTAFVVVDLTGGIEVDREVRDVGSCTHGDQPDPGHRRRHRDLVETVRGCDVVIAGGMGLPVQDRLRETGIDVTLTDIRSIDEAIQAYSSGTITHDPGRAHAPGGDHH